MLHFDTNPGTSSEAAAGSTMEATVGGNRGCECLGFFEQGYAGLPGCFACHSSRLDWTCSKRLDVVYNIETHL